MLKQAALLLLISTLAPSARADTPCTKVDVLSVFSTYIKSHPAEYPSTPDVPEPQSSIEWIRNQLAYKTLPLLEITTTAPPIRWMGIEWEGPIGGILVAVDCQGAILDGSSDGGVEQMSSGPVLPEVGASVLVGYTDLTGTGVLHKTVTLYGIRAGKFLTLWSHDLKNLEMMLSSTPGKDTDYQVMFDASGKKISVNGVTKIYPLVKQPDGSLDISDKVGKIERTHEDFCWDPHKSYFGPCPKG